MNPLSTIAAAAALTISLAASAAPAQAAVFAQFTPDTNARDFRWINSVLGDTGSGGRFFSIAAQNATLAQGVATHFSFLDPALSALAFIPATFTVDVTVASGDPASVNGVGVWTQTNLNGNFSFIYNGPTINNYLSSGINLLNGSNLLSGVFTNAWIQGAGGSGSVNLAQVNGGSMSYTSDYEQFTNMTANTQEFAINLLASTNFGANGGSALRGFRANGGGNFSFDVASAPEPATWGLMIAGFGGIGLVMRSRRRHAAATI
jgi:hypothetical protein